jgi:peptidyl-prolyl isomerase E (cyclophilin E)
MSKKSNTLIYVGGLDDTVSEEVLHAAFIPFGELKSIQIPKDYKESKC